MLITQIKSCTDGLKTTPNYVHGQYSAVELKTSHKWMYAYYRNYRICEQVRN